MDSSVDDIDDSILPHLASRRLLAPPPVGLGLSHPFPRNLPDPNESYEYALPGTSPAAPGAEADDEEGDEDEEVGDEEEEEAEESGDEEEEGEEDGTGSEGSSILFDRDMDPEGWAKRLDEIAGVLEMNEVENRAIRWGPAIGRQNPDFKDLLNRHLNNTEWKYDAAAYRLPLLSRGLVDDPIGPGLPGLHPIRVLGKGWIGRDVEGGEWEDDLTADDGERHAMEGLMPAQ